MGTWSRGSATSLADAYEGVSSSETADGLGGNDTLRGYGGNDNLIGNTGDDEISGGAGSDTLNGGDGNDNLSDSDGFDYFSGGNGDDTITDYDITNYGDTTNISGGNGYDAIYVSSAVGEGTISGGAQTDFLEFFVGHEDYAVDLTRFDISGVERLNGSMAFYGFQYNFDAFTYLRYSGDDATLGSQMSITFLDIGSVNLYDELGPQSAYIATYGSGNNYVQSGSGNDNLVGGTGNDTLDSSWGDDVVSGRNGDDVLYGYIGNDTLYGDYGNDYVDADNGDDLIYDTDGNDTLYGGYGNDSIYDLNFLNSATPVLAMNGDSGDDLLFAGTYINEDASGYIYGGAGNDTLVVYGGELYASNMAIDVENLYTGTYTFYGMSDQMEAFSTIRRSASAADLAQTARLIFTEHHSVEAVTLDLSEELGAQSAYLGQRYVASTNLTLTTGSGNDFINGNSGEDLLTGNAGNDTLEGDYGDDTLNGNDGDDELQGLYGADHVFGGAGNDMLMGYSSDDELVGGIGNDTLIGDDFWVDGAPFTGNSADGGYDVINGGDGNDLIYGDAFTDGLVGGEGNDTIYGDQGNSGSLTPETAPFFNPGNDYIEGGAGNDALWGEYGNDAIYGGAGNDQLSGSDGADYLDGGDDEDHIYDYNDVAASTTIYGGNGDDWIYIDELALTGRIDGGAGADQLGLNHHADVALVDLTLTALETLSTFSTRQITARIAQFEAFDSIKHAYNAATQIQLALADTGVLDLSSELGAQAVRIAAYSGGNAITTGSGADYLIGSGVADTLNGGAGNDRFAAGAGNDVISDLNSVAGAATIDGGDGNDTITIDKVTAGGIYGAAGTDSLRINASGLALSLATLDISGIETLYLTNNSFLGTVAWFETLETLRYSSDTATLTTQIRLLLSNAGTLDLASELSNQAVNLTLFSGGNNVVLGGGADRITNSDASDTINGGAGFDIVYFKNDFLTYTISPVSGSGPFTVTGQGTDTLVQIERAVFKDGEYEFSTGFFTPYPATIIGGAGNDLVDATHVPAGQHLPTWVGDFIYGNGGNDTLDGGLGPDQMYGGVGNDLYYVESTGDKTFENSGEGNDTVRSAIDWTLAANVEALILTGSAVNGTGNDGSNTITGTGGSNALSGLGGNDSLFGGARWDTLTGGAGNDTLDGGLDNDQMFGGLGDDIYYVDNTGDRVNESTTANEGSDTVYAAISWNLTANVEAVVLTGTGNTSSVGNALHNTMTGNAGNNTLTGGVSHDTIFGMDGNDSLDGGIDSDVLDGGNGNDTVLGGQRWDTLSGGAGDDVLDGGTENDRMSGNAGNDTYYLDHVGDRVLELAGEGTDTVYASIDWAMSPDVEVLFLTGGALVGTGNGLNNRIVGTNARNTLNGGNGNDTLTGGAGADTLTGGTGRDDFVFNAAASNGTDRITDFVHGIDRLVFRGSDYGFAAGHVLTAAQFTAGSSAVGAGAQFIWDAATKHLYWDVDGTGSSARIDLGLLDGATVTRDDLVFS